jgi:adenine-specific DNA-methyltransferase
MGRRWIGIEMGEHAVTHCLPRLQKVVAGEQGGISAAVGWQGGGGFRFLELGAPLFDAGGEIHPDVKFADLAAFIWMRETGTALPALTPGTPRLGVHEGQRRLSAVQRHPGGPPPRRRQRAHQRCALRTAAKLLARRAETGLRRSLPPGRRTPGRRGHQLQAAAPRGAALSVLSSTIG